MFLDKQYVFDMYVCVYVCACVCVYVCVRVRAYIHVADGRRWHVFWVITSTTNLK